MSFTCDVVVTADLQAMTAKGSSTWKHTWSINAIPSPATYSQPCGPLFLTQVIHLQIFTHLPSRHRPQCLSSGETFLCFFVSFHDITCVFYPFVHWKSSLRCKTLEWNCGKDVLDSRMLSECLLVNSGYGLLRVCRSFGSAGAFVTRKLKSVLWLALCSPGRYDSDSSMLAFLSHFLLFLASLVFGTVNPLWLLSEDWNHFNQHFLPELFSSGDSSPSISVSDSLTNNSLPSII